MTLLLALACVRYDNRHADLVVEEPPERTDACFMWFGYHVDGQRLGGSWIATGDSGGFEAELDGERVIGEWWSAERDQGGVIEGWLWGEGEDRVLEGYAWSPDWSEVAAFYGVRQQDGSEAGWWSFADGVVPPLRWEDGEVRSGDEVVGHYADGEADIALSTGHFVGQYSLDEQGLGWAGDVLVFEAPWRWLYGFGAASEGGYDTEAWLFPLACE